MNIDVNVEVEMRMEQLHDSEFQAIVMKYSDIFKNELSDYLSFIRDLVHEIDINDSEFINQLIYQLST